MARTNLGYLATTSRDSQLRPLTHGVSRDTTLAQYWNNSEQGLVPLNDIKIYPGGLVVPAGITSPR